MKIKKYRLFEILIFILFLALLEPTGLTFTSMHRVFGLLRYVALGVAVCLCVGGKVYKNSFFRLLMLFLATFCISTLLYSGSLSKDLTFFVRISFAGIVFATYYLKKDSKFLFFCLAIIFSSFILLDAITWGQNGIDGNGHYFLGTKTTITYYLMPAFAFDDLAYAASEKNRERLFAIVLWGFTIGGAVSYLSKQPISTAIICGILACICIFFSNKNARWTEFICKWGFLFTVGLTVMILMGNIFDIFSLFITNVLHESADFNGRTQIWEMVLLYIARRPITGYGISSDVVFDVWESTNASTHNYYLSILFQTGVIGMVVYGLIIYFIHKRNIDKLHIPVIKYLFFVLIIMNIEGIYEHYGTNLMTFCFLVIVGNTHLFIDKIRE